MIVPIIFLFAFVSSTGAKQLSCSQFEVLDDFSDYLKALKRETEFDAALLQDCKVEICNAVYGIGNPDISGIGAAASYVLETALSLILSLAVIFLRKQTGSHGREAHGIFTSGLRAFFYSAAYFALANQFATIAVLVRKDYGLSTAELGALEAQVAQAVAVQAF
ncbi:hypothetical protein AK830_g3626 [Neonectria ditissima]|uniref:MARVEL domain-containing protein n=1 Tax=Neonectria ditissima TaxID=78410 RepID=A0A0P7AY87_9HYPO|nr:hypothetical protein AK830_g3626 [Neonectria ditissima]